MTFAMLFHHTYLKIAIVIAIVGVFLATRQKPVLKIIGTIITILAAVLYFYTLLFLR
jgi:uncharacterized Tic20 family protein